MITEESTNSFFNYVWPIDYTESTNRNETIKVTLRKFIFYLIFLVIATTVMISMLPVMAFTFTTAIKGQFIDVEFSSGGDKEPISYDDIRTAEEFWTYLAIVAAPNMYKSEWRGSPKYNFTASNDTDTDSDDPGNGAAPGGPGGGGKEDEGGGENGTDTNNTYWLRRLLDEQNPLENDPPGNDPPGNEADTDKSYWLRRLLDEQNPPENDPPGNDPPDNEADTDKPYWLRRLLDEENSSGNDTTGNEPSGNDTTGNNTTENKTMILIAPTFNKTILVENRLLGAPRLRQLRVRNDSCVIPLQFRQHLKKACYAPYSTSNADTSSAEFNYTPSDSYLYYFGSVSTYGSGGYIELFANNTNATLLRIVELYNDFWITQGTRAIFLDFTVFNPNLNLFCIVKLIFEFPASGGVLASSSFLTVKLMRYNHPFDFVIMGLEFVYICYIFYFIVQEIRNCKFHKRKYWTFFWSYVNILIILCSLLLIPFNVYKWLCAPSKIKEISQNPDEYADMEFIALCQWTLDNTEAVLLFLIWIKILQFLKLSKTMGQVEATLLRCGKEIMVFSLMFFIIFFSFALQGYVLFGSQHDHFSTVQKSLMTLLITILGDLDYYTIQKQNRFLAPIFFTAYIFFVFFVSFNMFLAIITGTFANVKADIKIEKDDLEVGEFLLRLPKKLFRKLFRKLFPKFAKPKQNTLKLSGTETLEEITTILKLLNMTYDEIDQFFEKYGITRHSFSNDQLLELLEDIKKYKPGPELHTEEKSAKSSMKFYKSLDERYDAVCVHYLNVSGNLEKLLRLFENQDDHRQSDNP